MYFDGKENQNTQNFVVLYNVLNQVKVVKSITAYE